MNAFSSSSAHPGSRAAARLACALLLTLGFGGCDDPETDNDEAATSGASQTSGAESTGDDSTSSGERGWEMTYSGGHSGEIAGPTMSAVAIGDTVSFGGSNLEFEAAHSIIGIIPLAEGTTGTAAAESFSAQLADGTVCQSDDEENAVLNITVTNAELASYAMEFSGTLDWSGTPITVEGFLRR